MMGAYGKVIGVYPKVVARHDEAVLLIVFHCLEYVEFKTEKFMKLCWGARRTVLRWEAV